MAPVHRVTLLSSSPGGWLQVTLQNQPRDGTSTQKRVLQVPWLGDDGVFPAAEELVLFTVFLKKKNHSLFVPSAAMARGPKKHLKYIAAPKHWMLDKLTGVFAPRPSTGPHKLRECLKEQT